MSRVWVFEKPKSELDMSEAAKFGELTTVFDSDDRRCSAFHHVDWGAELVSRLKAYGFDPVNDYVCIVGSMLVVSVGLIVVSQTWDEFNVLIYNSLLSTYVEKRIRKEDWNGKEHGSDSSGGDGVWKSSREIRGDVQVPERRSRRTEG